MQDYAVEQRFIIKGAKSKEEAAKAVRVALGDMASQLDYGLDDMPDGVDLTWSTVRTEKVVEIITQRPKGAK